MPKSMPCKHENVTEAEANIATLVDLLTALPTSDRADIIKDLPHHQKLTVAKLLAAKIKENTNE
jgi:Mg/Co/Ni transporter MgtE